MFAMKYVLCVALFAVGLSHVQAISKEEMGKIFEKLHPHIIECSKEYGLQEAALKEAKEKGSHDGINTCFFACVFKKAEIMDDKGQFNIEKAMEHSKEFLTSEDDIKNAADVIQECSSVNSESVGDGDAGCDRAKLLVVCLGKNKEKFWAPV